jgi:hypothetical protein
MTALISGAGGELLGESGSAAANEPGRTTAERSADGEERKSE